MIAVVAAAVSVGAALWSTICVLIGKRIYGAIVEENAQRLRRKHAKLTAIRKGHPK